MDRTRPSTDAHVSSARGAQPHLPSLTGAIDSGLLGNSDRYQAPRPFAKQDAASRDPSLIRATFAGSRVEFLRGVASPTSCKLRETTSPPCSRERASRTMPAVRRQLLTWTECLAG